MINEEHIRISALRVDQTGLEDLTLSWSTALIHNFVIQSVFHAVT